MDVKNWLRAEWDRVVGFGLIALGALFLVRGYAGVSDSPYVVQGLSYIMSGGIGGLFMLGAGATLLISADIHDEWRKIDRVEAALRSGEGVPFLAAFAPESNGHDAGPGATARLEMVEQAHRATSGRGNA